MYNKKFKIMISRLKELIGINNEKVKKVISNKVVLKI